MVNAHGYFDNGSGWSAAGLASFADIGILNEVLAEAGISFSGQWNWRSNAAQMSAMGQGVVEFGRRLGSGLVQAGLAQLGKLLGGPVTIKEGSFFGRPNALLPGTSNVKIPFANDDLYNRTTIVHELAHVIDWHNSMWVGTISYGQTHLQPFSMAWSGAALTDYAESCIGCVRAWERWAEAVTVWVFGQYDAAGNFSTSYYSSQVGDHAEQRELNNQMALMTAFLK